MSSEQQKQDADDCATIRELLKAGCSMPFSQPLYPEAWFQAP